MQGAAAPCSPLSLRTHSSRDTAPISASEPPILVRKAHCSKPADSDPDHTLNREEPQLRRAPKRPKI